MIKLIVFLLVFAIVFWLEYIPEQNASSPSSTPQSQGLDNAIRVAFENRQSDIQVRGKGTVIKVLPDDLDGSRHQRIILELGDGQSLLIAHNIDLAPRVAGLKRGDTVEFYGEYEWNSRGGVIHWTHHDPNRRHINGWLKHRDRTYQ